jgi:hypothetical protein
MLDTRRSARSPAYLGGKIIYNNDLWSEECVVRNVSQGGALLRVTDPRTLPDRFKLAVTKHNVEHNARVRWRCHNALGVVFETSTPAEVIDLAAVRSRLLKKRLPPRD